MIKKILILIILTSCSTQNSTKNSNILSSNFDKYLSFEDFKNILIEYANKAPYPDINE